MRFITLEDEFFLVTPDSLRRVPSPIGGRLRDGQVVAGADAETEGRLFQVIVALGEVPHAVFLRGSAMRASDDDVALAIRRLHGELGEGQVAVVEDEGTGWAVVTSDESGRPEDTAAAVATVKWRWGWDGSNPMDIVVGMSRYRVELHAEAGRVGSKVSLHDKPARAYGVSKELRQGIRERARRGRSEFPPAPTDIRELARSCQVLPLRADEQGLYAIRHDGEVVHYDWDDAERARREKLPAVPTIESDSKMRDTLIHGAVARYPFLSPLLPQRPDGATPCPECGGTGASKSDDSEASCQCGGLGFIPESWNEGLFEG